MKKRYIVFAAVVIVFLAAALIIGACRNSVTAVNVRDFAAENFRGSSETEYRQVSLYCTEDKYLTPDGMMRLRNTIEEKLTAEGIVPDGNYRLCGSYEQNVSVTRDIATTDAVATVYFGDYFSLHPFFPISGGYLEENSATTDYCVIDDLTAWRIFGSTDVCGLDLQINGSYYTVNAVVPADRGVYAEYYGASPRVYILYNSAAERVRSQQTCFTSLECIMADPITDFAKDTFTEAVSEYGDGVVDNTERFTPLRLWSNIRSMTSLGVLDGETCPYYENVSRIMETKCAILLAFEGSCYIIAAVCFCILAYLVLHPVAVTMHEKRIARKRHAI